MVAFHSPPEPSPTPPEVTPTPPAGLTFAAHNQVMAYYTEADARKNNRARWAKDAAVASDRETYPDHDTSGSPYRSPAPRAEPDAIPWCVTRWQKLYVRVARVLFDVRGSYREGREWRNYRRALLHWHEANPRVDGRLPQKAPPMPCPPPAYVWE